MHSALPSASERGREAAVQLENGANKPRGRAAVSTASFSRRRLLARVVRFDERPQFTRARPQRLNEVVLVAFTEGDSGHLTDSGSPSDGFALGGRAALMF